MTVSYKITIDILNFIRTGQFDCLKPGQTKEWILNNFPDPDDIGMGNSLENAQIWFYGNIELHFDKDKLFLIFSESIVDLNGGKSLKLNKWVLSDTENLKLSNFIQKLNIAHIDFSKKTEKYDLEYVRLRIFESNVEFTFVDEEKKLNNPNEFKLSSFGLSRV
jgi:hypothetical protein